MELANLLAVHLERLGMHTPVCNRAQHALKFLKKNFANLVLLDINLPDQTGFSLVDDLKAADISVPIIFVTGNNEEPSRVKGLDIDGDDYVTKPFTYPSSSRASAPCCDARRISRTSTSRRT